MVVGIGFSGTTRAGVPSRFGVLQTLLAVYVGAPLRARRGRFYGISYEYRKDRQPLREDLTALLQLMAEGKLQPRIAGRLPLLAAREGGAMVERGGVEGTIVHLA